MLLQAIGEAVGAAGYPEAHRVGAEEVMQYKLGKPIEDPQFYFLLVIQKQGGLSLLSWL